MPGRPDDFTVEELAFMRDGAIFDRKEELTRRIQGLLADLRKALMPRLDPDAFLAPDGTDFENGQLVRGERFHQRPYAYLDYPKYFSRQAMFTYRSFFWWGWDFVFAFMLSGPHLKRYQTNLLMNLAGFQNGSFYLSVAADPWEWRKTSPGTLQIEGRGADEIRDRIKDMSYLKIQYFLGLDHPAWLEGGIVARGLEVFDAMRCVVAR